jgi:hypothetical protein
MSERCVSRSNEAVRSSRVLIQNSRVTRLATIAAFKVKSKQRAAAARAKAETGNPKAR